MQKQNISTSIIIFFSIFIIVSIQDIHAQQIFYVNFKNNFENYKSYYFCFKSIGEDTLQISYAKPSKKDVLIEITIESFNIEKAREILMKTGFENEFMEYLENIFIDTLKRTFGKGQKEFTYVFKFCYCLPQKYEKEYEIKYRMNNNDSTEIQYKIAKRYHNSYFDSLSVKKTDTILDEIGLHKTLMKDISIDLYNLYIYITFKEKIKMFLEKKDKIYLGSMSLRNKVINVYRENVDSAKKDTGILDCLINPINEIYYFLRPKEYKDNNIDSTKIGVLDISNVSIAFQDGIIKDILVNGIFVDTLGKNRREMFFHSSVPISISTAKQIDVLNDRKSFSLSGENIWEKHNWIQTAIPLGDVIKYERTSLVTGNYIPENEVIYLTYDSSKTWLPLHKKAFVEDFDIRIYTDFMGFEKNNPNGLIQTEGKYNIILNTLRMPTWGSNLFACLSGVSLLSGIYSQSNGSEWFKNNMQIPLFSAAGLAFIAAYLPTFPLNKISPFIALTRMEDKVSNLSLGFKQDTSGKNLSNYIRTFDLFRYSNLSIGLELNLYKSNFVSSNLNFNLNLTGGFYQTSLDSVLSDVSKQSVISSNLLSWFLLPEISFQTIYSDKIDFILNYGLLYSRLLNNKINDGSPEIDQQINGYFIHKFQINFNIYSDPDNRDSWIFLRGTIYINRPYTNLSLQIGYSTSISKIFGGTK